MDDNSSTKYYQKNKATLQKNSHEQYKNLPTYEKQRLFEYRKNISKSGSTACSIVSLVFIAWKTYITASRGFWAHILLCFKQRL